MLLHGDGVPPNYEEAYRYYLEYSKTGDPNSMNVYMKLFCNDNINKFFESETAKYYKQEADKKNVKGLLNYANILFIGKGVPQNKKEGIKLFKMAADMGDIGGMFVYASKLRSGDGIETNKKEAARYFKMAADKGNGDALFPLANMLENGEGIPQNKEEAAKYYKMSASIGDVNAMYNYASMNYNGNGIKRNIREAATYFKMAADHGDAESAGIFKILQRQYGNIHYEIKEPYQDLNVRCLNDINIDKNANANYFMGLYYYQNVHVPRDINKAIDYFLLAGNSNHPEAQLILGYIYYQGEFVDQDMNKALHYLHESANNNNKNAQFILGYIYSNQLKDIKKASTYYFFATKQKLALAHLNLGILYFNECAKSDIKQAIHYFQLASDQNEPKSLFILGMLYFKGELFPFDINKAICYFTLAAKYKYNRSQFVLATIYLLGKYISKDIQKSIEYYEEASNLNNNLAKNNLGMIYLGAADTEKNISLAIKVFKSANDYLSFYNLAHWYFYNFDEKSYIDETIKLLIKSSHSNFKQAKFLLCLAVCKKYSKISIRIINYELNRYEKVDISFAKEIFNLIKKNGLDNEAQYKECYQLYSQKSYFYNFSGQPVLSNNIFNTKRQPLLKNLNHSFYDGFGNV
ncbi:hypothetical protein M9Y10_007861 [Tritrichomonas musculus]|uniref:Uncharacterized protein n=1 Tax=Tritrichomonas musculus TaxID=1915356 RepID=A0ABR2J3A1_9EUKA